MCCKSRVLTERFQNGSLSLGLEELFGLHQSDKGLFSVVEVSGKQQLLYQEGARVDFLRSAGSLAIGGGSDQHSDQNAQYRLDEEHRGNISATSLSQTLPLPKSLTMPRRGQICWRTFKRKWRPPGSSSASVTSQCTIASVGISAASRPAHLSS